MDWRDTINNLWIERLIWVRQFIVSIIMGLRDLQFVEQRIQRNSAEFGRLIGYLYGAEAGERFEDLLRQYILILSEVVSTIKAGQDIEPLMEQWYKTAEDIGAFLFQLNPYWQKEAVQALINDQLQLERDLAQELKREQFGEGIAAFDLAYNNALRAAQLMIYGIEMHSGYRPLAGT